MEIIKKDGEKIMTKRYKTKSSSWKRYKARWKYYSDLEFKIANSLSPKTPYGRNPNTKKTYKSSTAFVRAIRHAEKMKEQYKKSTKLAYKRQEGKSY